MKKLDAKDGALIGVREELTKEVDKNEKLKKKIEDKVLEAERRGRELCRIKFLAF